MGTHEASRATTTEGLPVSPSLGDTLEAAAVPPHSTFIDRRTVVICGIAILIALAAGLIAQALLRLIHLFTHLAFFGELSFEPVSPAGHSLGAWVIAVPVVGGVIVGLMARYGSKAIRGHGIPEAMEQVLTNQSRIPPRMTFLKPLSAAVSIGTGGPFGAEGPIIATGGALGSLIGQLLHTTANERKTLLAAGAAAGMAATFGSPVSALILAVELLLFEYHPRSLIPVALGSAVAAGVRVIFEGSDPVIPMPDTGAVTAAALGAYILIGAILGVASVAVTRAIYAVEDAFERLPIHWMWWPAIGAVAVGVVGYFAPRTLGVGYSNLSDLLAGNLPLQAVLMLCAMKFISWSISLGSGTSGGTLAPLLTIGGCLGALLGSAATALAPHSGIDPRMAALVGMAALFAGASRAVLASVVFAFEITLQPHTLSPLLGGCAASFFVSCLLMRNSIMSEKIVRRGVRVPTDYSADILGQISVRDAMHAEVVSLKAEETVDGARRWIAAGGSGTTHQGFPVFTSGGMLAGVVTRKDLLPLGVSGDARIGDLIRRTPVVVYADCSLRQAMDHMVNHHIGRLPVIDRESPGRVCGMLTRGDILTAYRRCWAEGKDAQRGIEWRTWVLPASASKPS